MAGVPGGYDPVTLVHWLWWKLRCHEGSAEDFQKLFENVIKRVQPEFEANVGRPGGGCQLRTRWTTPGSRRTSRPVHQPDPAPRCSLAPSGAPRRSRQPLALPGARPRRALGW
jgi:hypothetical protein